ncbi:MAG: CDP-archaeol synthase [Flavobacteriales bacterium]
MNSLLQHSLIVVLPLVMTNTLHMLVVKKAWLQSINIPISDKLFGKNKTWRGFAFLVVVNALIVLFITRICSIPLENSALIGAILGFTYLLFELPNSYMKRKLGVGPGEQHQRYRYFFSWIDKSDSAFGLSLVYFLMGYVDWKNALLLYCICSGTHVISSFILVKLKIKASF